MPSVKIIYNNKSPYSILINALCQKYPLSILEYKT